MKKRKNKGSHIKRYGIDFYVSEIKQVGVIRPQLYISLREPDGTSFKSKDGSRPSARPYGDTEHLEKAHTAMEALIVRYRDEITDWMRKRLLPEATPILLLLLMPEDERGKMYGRDTDGARKQLLRNALEKFPLLTDLGDAQTTVQLLKAVSKTAKERNILGRMVENLYDFAVRCGVWEQNPLVHLYRFKIPESTKASKNLVQRRLCIAEMQRLVAICQERQREDLRYAAVLLAQTTCVAVGELCALNVADVRAVPDLIFLEIRRSISKKREKKAKVEWTMYKWGENARRRVPCTQLAQTALKPLLRRPGCTDFKGDEPLLVDEDGRRLEPAKYRRFEDKVLAEVVPEYAKLSSRSDVVQSSVRGYCRDVCGMTASRMMRIFGLKAESTYEEWYVDYSSRIALLATRARLERCHKLLQSGRQPENAQLHIRLKLKRGAKIRFTAKSQIRLAVLL
ncbi:MAG: hypothetical protein ACLUI6_04165 [Butyricicoccus sp.]